VSGPVFVSFEGIDGSGKTTQVGRLVGHLEEQGRQVRVFREPGGTPLGERIRELVLEQGEVAPWAEVSLFAAARAQLVETAIRPALAAGFDVVCDRYLDSSIAYQGLARGLGADAVRDWSLRVTGGLLPDLTFLLTLSADLAAARIGAGASSDPARSDASLDRLEQESTRFRERVEAGYRELAREAPDRIIALDAAQPPDRIAEWIVEILDARAVGRRTPREGS
jgi:dTMP kinase